MKIRQLAFGVLIAWAMVLIILATSLQTAWAFYSFFTLPVLVAVGYYIERKSGEMKKERNP